MKFPIEFLDQYPYKDVKEIYKAASPFKAVDHSENIIKKDKGTEILIRYLTNRLFTDSSSYQKELVTHTLEILEFDKLNKNKRTYIGRRGRGATTPILFFGSIEFECLYIYNVLNNSNAIKIILLSDYDEYIDKTKYLGMKKEKEITIISLKENHKLFRLNHKLQGIL
jgi:hypothetical protein